ncbi:cupin domain-containing protein [Candidatus Kaiserbacteria bacterium]|nr:MAG: cupin domain-containing protein [Candidatus Kaiserbacteria bacterium]
MKKGYHAHIERLTEENTDFRRVLYTAESLQLVLMTLAPLEEIGMETHHENDQFFRFESGEGKVVVNETEHHVSDGDCVIVPKGAKHNIINISSENPLTMYTIYTPPHHMDGTIHPTKEYAESHEEDFEGTTTEK